MKTQIFFFQSLELFRVRPNTKNNGVLQGKFCIFTCPKDWHFSWKMNTRISVQNVTFRLPGSLFFNQQEVAFYLIVSQRYLAGTAKKTLDLERRTVQKKTTFCFSDWKPNYPEHFSFSVPFSIITHEHSKKIHFSTSYEYKELG